MTDVIDWDKPLEAYHPDGRVIEVTASAGTPLPFTGGVYHIRPELPDGNYIYQSNGRHTGNGLWRIRNRQPKPKTAADMPDRMEALVRRMATRRIETETGLVPAHAFPDFHEARAIVSELTPLVDPDEEEAWAIYARWGGDNPSGWLQPLTAAIKRGRELERQGKA